MRNYARKAAVSLIAGAALTAGALTPAQAAPVITGGLVNVTVTDVLRNVTVQDINVALGVALGVAANACDVNVNVLAQQLRNGSATCQNATDPVTATITQI